ncbi:hypothetical protein CTAYLR_005119 [Chrysophaeum taylorii]|uniref:histone deacetylase n=1 Tax=Chrysophaeum taylorii TaxID=2483200 RepID=A0AAD7UFM8_9STRA|nr:hypothetical protein CTAYLR_005119 [Chrysophaeum taylorii]
MEDHFPVGDASHPEQPERHAAIVKAMRKNGLEERCAQLESRHAVEEEILELHSARYVAALAQSAKATRKYRAKLVKEFEHDVYVNASTWTCARLALGCALEACASVVAGRHAHAMAVIRPPGHHACAKRASGFCFLNSVATCAKLATNGKLVVDRGRSERTLFALDRVLIVDWDVHHGNGTQAFCYDDPKILYFSVHRGFESRKTCGSALFYPGTGKPSETASGLNINCRWSEPGAGDAEYAACWRRLLLPVAAAYQPQLVLVSAGFDAARGDPLGECCVTPRGYYEMLAPLARLAPVCLMLEGGYHLDMLGRCFCACATALLGDPPPADQDEEDPCCDPTAADDITETIRAHLRYWPTLKASLHDLVDGTPDTLATRLVDIALDPAILEQPKFPKRKYTASDHTIQDGGQEGGADDDRLGSTDAAAAAVLADLVASTPTKRGAAAGGGGGGADLVVVAVQAAAAAAAAAAA